MTYYILNTDNQLQTCSSKELLLTEEEGTKYVYTVKEGDVFLLYNKSAVIIYTTIVLSCIPLYRTPDKYLSYDVLSVKELCSE